MVVSVHHYELAESAEPSDLRDAVGEAVSRGLFEAVPGLIDYHIGRGIKGAREGKFAAVWVYESKAAWEDLWGPADDPIGRAQYPDAWRTWEDELLDQLLADDPDRIEYTSYQLVSHSHD